MLFNNSIDKIEENMSNWSVPKQVIKTIYKVDLQIQTKLRYQDSRKNIFNGKKIQLLNQQNF